MAERPVRVRSTSTTPPGAVVVGLIGARVDYVAENWWYFHENGWIRVFYVNKLDVDQAVARVDRRISFWILLYAAGRAKLIGLAVRRIGDVINGEHHGSVADLPWGVRYVNAHSLGQRRPRSRTGG